jgi:hypothetical protein
MTAFGTSIPKASNWHGGGWSRALDL